MARWGWWSIVPAPPTVHFHRRWRRRICRSTLIGGWPSPGNRRTPPIGSILPVSIRCAASLTACDGSNMTESDVLIVGAGPAGSVAAYVLARAGRRVLLVDTPRHEGRKLGE